MEKAIRVLLAEYYLIAGRIVGEYFLRINKEKNEDLKNSIEAQDLMKALLTGKGFNEEWKLEESEDWKDFTDLAKALNFLHEKVKEEKNHGNS